MARRGHLGRAAGAAPRRARDGARAAAGPARLRRWRRSTRSTRTAIDGLAGGGGDPALAACELWERALDEVGEPLPGVEAGLRWLRLNAPPPGAASTLVHGDFRLGNLIVDEHGLAAVIDWELCHAGDPAEDIGWLCIRSWRFGNDELPVAGVGGLEACWRPTRAPAARARSPSGCAGGRRWATSSGR